MRELRADWIQPWNTETPATSSAPLMGFYSSLKLDSWVAATPRDKHHRGARSKKVDDLGSIIGWPQMTLDTACASGTRPLARAWGLLRTRSCMWRDPAGYGLWGRIPATTTRGQRGPCSCSLPTSHPAGGFDTGYASSLQMSQVRGCAALRVGNRPNVQQCDKRKHVQAWLRLVSLIADLKRF